MSRLVVALARRGRAPASERVGEAAFVRGLTASVLAAMMAIAATSNASGQPRIPDGTVIDTAAPGAASGAATGTAAGPQETYRSRVRGEMADWRQKMQTFDERVEAGGRHAANATEVRLRAAWDDAEVEARNVQTASAVDWNRAKRAYEAASHRMALAWDKARV